MDIDLKHAFEDLATDVSAPEVSTDDLWRRGVRRRNRRRAAAATAALAAIAVVAGAVGLAATPGVLRDEQPPLTAPTVEARLPDRVWMPSPWTPGTSRAGDPGRIAVLFWDNGRRRSLGSLGLSPGGGFVSVSALDGKYRYLDLPDLVFGGVDAPVLSPDGRYLAYPLRTAGADDAVAVSTGWAVYDALTGRVVRHLPEGTPKGVGGGGLVWTPDSKVLLMDVCRVTEVSRSSQSCTTTRTDAWEVPTGRTWTLTGPLASEVVGRSGDDLLVRRADVREIGVLDVSSGEVETTGRLAAVPEESEQRAGLDPGAHLATVATAGADISEGSVDRTRVVVTREDVRTGERVGRPGTPTGPVQHADLLDVRDDGQVAALLTDVGDTPRLALLGRTSVTDVVRFDDGWTGAVPRVASDLLDAPTTPGVEPPQVKDPRAVSGGVALALAGAAGLALAWWRRRSLRDVSA